MKKWFFLLLSLPVLWASCVKVDNNKCTYTDSPLVATTAEINYLQTYITSNSIVATQHSSGVFYNIDSMGSGAYPSICSNLTVKYKGYLLGNPAAFDSVTSVGGVNFSLGGVIVGWQKVLPLLKAGGKMTLYTPPSLAYGAVDKRNGDGDIIIPANSNLKFTIELLNVQ